MKAASSLSTSFEALVPSSELCRHLSPSTPLADVALAKSASRSFAPFAVNLPTQTNNERTTPMTTTTTPATGKAALLAALRQCGIEASPRTLATWMDTADKLCMALATYYRAAEPQAVRTIASLEESASEFRLLDV